MIVSAKMLSIKSHRINIRLSRPDLKKLDDLAKKNGKRRSAILREALHAFYKLDSNPIIMVEPQRVVVRREVSNG